MYTKEWLREGLETDCRRCHRIAAMPRFPVPLLRTLLLALLGSGVVITAAFIGLVVLRQAAPREVPFPAQLPAILRPLITQSGTMLLTLQPNAARLRIPGRTVLSGPLALRSLPLLSPAPDVLIALRSPRSAIEAAFAGITEAERAIAQGLLAKRAQEMLEGEWSWTYDILPLLSGETILAVDAGGSAFLIRGMMMTDARRVKEILATVHDHLRSELTGTAVMERTLDRGFTSAVLRSDPSQVIDRQESVGGWSVRETREAASDSAAGEEGSRTTRSLLSAVRGREFLIGNQESWLRQMISAGAPAGRIDLPGIPVAAGTISPALLRRLLFEHADPEWSTLVMQLETMRGAAHPRCAAGSPSCTTIDANTGIRWALESDGQGGRLSLTLSPQ